MKQIPPRSVSSVFISGKVLLFSMLDEPDVPIPQFRTLHLQKLFLPPGSFFHLRDRDHVRERAIARPPGRPTMKVTATA